MKFQEPEVGSYQKDGQSMYHPMNGTWIFEAGAQDKGDKAWMDIEVSKARMLENIVKVYASQQASLFGPLSVAHFSPQHYGCLSLLMSSSLAASAHDLHHWLPLFSFLAPTDESVAFMFLLQTQTQTKIFLVSTRGCISCKRASKVWVESNLNVCLFEQTQDQATISAFKMQQVLLITTYVDYCVLLLLLRLLFSF